MSLSRLTYEETIRVKRLMQSGVGMGVDGILGDLDCGLLEIGIKPRSWGQV